MSESKHAANEPGSGKASDEQGYSIPFVHCFAAFCSITFSFKGKKRIALRNTLNTWIYIFPTMNWKFLINWIK